MLHPVSNSLSSAVLILPEGKPGPDYRDEPNPPPSILNIMGENTLAMVLQLPHLVLPSKLIAVTKRGSLLICVQLAKYLTNHVSAGGKSISQSVVPLLEPRVQSIASFPSRVADFPRA